MSIKEYKNAFSGIEPDEGTREALINQILREERQKKRAGRHLRPGILAACAAVMVLGLSVTAVAAFDINDIFQGFFRQQAQTQGDAKAFGGREEGEAQTVPLPSDDAFLASAGNVVYQETSADGLKLTVRGTVSDGNALFAALNVETEDGGAFCEGQDGALRSYTFGEVWAQVEGGGRRRCSLERIDDGSRQGKAVFLLAETFDEPLQDKKISLELTDFLMSTNQVIDLEMDRSVGELLDSFEPLDEAAAASTGRTEGEDASGNTSAEESFIAARTEKRIPFSGRYPEASFSNLGIWTDASGNTSLLVNLELGGELTAELLEQKPLVLIDRRTGRELSGSVSCTSIGEEYAKFLFPDLEAPGDYTGDSSQDIICCRYQFNNISENQLKNAVFALGGDGSQEELFSGTWKLDFTVSYGETMKIWDFTGKDQAGGLPVKKILVSPISAIIEFDTLSDENADLERAALNLKNGSRIEAQAAVEEEDSGNGVKYRILWESVVNTEEIESISLNDSVISL